MLLEVKLFDSVDLDLTHHECHADTQQGQYFVLGFALCCCDPLCNYRVDFFFFMTHYFQWLPDIIIYLILFFLYEMQRSCHYPITLASELRTCCDLIAFLLIQNVHTSRAFSNHPHCSGNFPVWLREKMAFEMVLSLWCSGKKGSP